MELDAGRKRRLRDDGYVVVPGVVPPARVRAALREINHRLGLGPRPEKDAYADAVDYSSEYLSTPAIMGLLDKSPLPRLAESLLGAGKVEPCNQAQVALRFPARPDAPAPERLVHVDGLHSARHGPFARRPAKTKVRYTMGIGVMLSPLPRPFMGNFTVYPGTHRQLARKIKSAGLGSLRAGLEKALDLPEPVQVTGKPGDAVLFHYQLAHDKERNLSCDIRYMAFFRLWHADAWNDVSTDYLTRAMADPWLEWPGMRGLHGA